MNKPDCIDYAFCRRSVNICDLECEGCNDYKRGEPYYDTTNVIYMIRDKMRVRQKEDESINQIGKDRVRNQRDR